MSENSSANANNANCIPEWMRTMEASKRKFFVEATFNQSMVERAKQDLDHSIEILKLSASYERKLQEQKGEKPEENMYLKDIYRYVEGLSGVVVRTPDDVLKYAKVMLSSIQATGDLASFAKYQKEIDYLRKEHKNSAYFRERKHKREMDVKDEKIKDLILALDKEKIERFNMRDEHAALQKKYWEQKEQLDNHKHALSVLCVDPAVVPLPLPTIEETNAPKPAFLDNSTSTSTLSSSSSSSNTVSFRIRVRENRAQEANGEPRPKKRKRVRINQFEADLQKKIHEWWNAPPGERGTSAYGLQYLTNLRRGLSHAKVIDLNDALKVDFSDEAVLTISPKAKAPLVCFLSWLHKNKNQNEEKAKEQKQDK